MLLCDLMGRISALRHQPARLGLPFVPFHLAVAFDELDAVSSVVSASRRHVLEDEVIAAATGVVLSRPSSMRDCLSALRIPWRATWIEWNEAARLSTRTALGIVQENQKARPHRLGMLVEADEDGRRGTVRFAWSHATETEMGSHAPSVCPLALTYDFEKATDPAAELPPNLREGSAMYALWSKSPAEVQALDEMNRCFGFQPTPEGAATVCAFDESGMGSLKAMLDSSRDDLDGEALSFVAVLMLLLARGAVQEEPQDRTKLNKARARKGEPPLNDHLSVRLRLSASERRTAAAERAEAGGAARRMHAVRGHFVNRQGNIFWRRAHTRGLGMPPAPARTVVVSL